MQLEAHHLKAAERPDQSGSCVKYCRPAAAVWECAAFWIKDNLHDRGWTVRTLDLCNYSQLQRLCPSADQDHHQLVSLPQAVLGKGLVTLAMLVLLLGGLAVGLATLFLEVMMVGTLGR
ncbi:uncharacterized protein LOC135097560 isoform X2 [Scylla paramamosain]|uniref:uncharacterized protein LOC135097560 isoform X2 n=1 Tax=Scylla paramamosain TaxID=85552 RepID=UPI003083801E